MAGCCHAGVVEEILRDVDSRASVCASAGGVARGGGRALKLAARVDQEAAGGCIAAGAGVVVEAVLIGAAVVVDDGRAEVKAVVERRAADGAGNGVYRLDARLPWSAQGPASSDEALDQCFVDFLRFVGCGAGIGVFNARPPLRACGSRLARVQGRMPRKTVSTKPSP